MFCYALGVPNDGASRCGVPNYGGAGPGRVTQPTAHAGESLSDV